MEINELLLLRYGVSSDDARLQAVTSYAPRGRLRLPHFLLANVEIQFDRSAWY